MYELFSFKDFNKSGVEDLKEKDKKILFTSKVVKEIFLRNSTEYVEYKVSWRS